MEFHYNLRVAAFLVKDEVYNRKHDLIRSFMDDLNTHFEKIDYQDGIKSVLIMFQIVNPTPEQVHLYKYAKPRYTEYEESQNPFKGTKHIVDRQYALMVQVWEKEFEIFMFGSDSESRCVLAKEILRSLKLILKLRKKIKNFDYDQFLMDIERYFQEKASGESHL